jgi:hypothetical protein
MSQAARILRVEVKRHYGQTTVYPRCPVSRLFCELLGQKTLTRENVEKIKKLGFEVKQEEVKL